MIKLFKKNLLIATLFILILIFFGCKKEKDLSMTPLPASANQLETQEDLITALEKAKNSEERKEIMEANREKLDGETVLALLKKADSSYADKTLNGEESRKLTEIAIEAGEFTGDKESLAKALAFSFEISDRDKKDMNLSNLEKALELFKDTGDKKGEITCLYKIAYYFGRNGEFEKVTEFSKKAEALLGEIDHTLFKADCYHYQGMLYYSYDRDRAMESYKKAIELYEKEEDFIYILDSYDSIAGCCFCHGFYEETEKYYAIIKELIEKYPDKLKNFPEREIGYLSRPSVCEEKETWMGRYYTSLANLYRWRGKYEEAIKTYKEAMELKDKIDSNHITDAYMCLGQIYSDMGRSDMALEYYLEALKTDHEEFEFDRCNIYRMIGNLYLAQMKKPDEAINYFQLALEEAEKLPRWKESYKSSITQELAMAFAEKGDFERAIKEMDKLTEFDEVACSPSYYLNLSKIYMKKGDKPKAIEYINKAIELNEKDPDIRYMAILYKQLGDCYSEDNNPAGAEEVYRKAVKIAENYRLLFLWEYYFSLGKVYERQGEEKGAYEAYNKSIECIENMRQEFTLEELKRDFMQDKIKVYEHMIDLLIKMKREDEAFKFNEKARARAFLDILANQKVEITHGVPSELLAKEEELNNRISLLSDAIREEKLGPGDEERSIFIEKSDKDLKALKMEYEKNLEEIKMKNPEYMSFISVNPFSLSEIQSLLDKDTAILEYFLCEDRAYLWIIDKNSLHTVCINRKRENIDSLVKSYREVAFDDMTVDKLGSDEWKEWSREIYTVLFKDAEEFVKDKKRLVIAPHRVLHYLPFHTLMDATEKTLIEKYEILYLPSASVLKFCQDKNHLKKDNLLAFEIGNFKIEEYPALPGTEVEVDKISSDFSEKEVYSGENMKTDVLYEKSGDFQILHFATHGILVPEAPLFSSLVFADKPLKVYEIFGLELNAYLVTLSACRTGFSEDAKGDELVGLSRAFIYAGSPSICSSLWDVSDKSTAELMERFYFHLKDKNKSEALRLAQLEIKEKYPHPFFWAPFVLTGDWR